MKPHIGGVFSESTLRIAIMHRVGEQYEVKICDMPLDHDTDTEDADDMELTARIAQLGNLDFERDMTVEDTALVITIVPATLNVAVIGQSNASVIVAV